jgi:hypothetical protein
MRYFSTDTKVLVAVINGTERSKLCNVYETTLSNRNTPKAQPFTIVS